MNDHDRCGLRPLCWPNCGAARNREPLASRPPRKPTAKRDQTKAIPHTPGSRVRHTGCTSARERACLCPASSPFVPARRALAAGHRALGGGRCLRTSGVAEGSSTTISVPVDWCSASCLTLERTRWYRDRRGGRRVLGSLGYGVPEDPCSGVSPWTGSLPPTVGVNQAREALHLDSSGSDGSGWNRVSW